MSSINFNCGSCGRELGLGERVSTDGVLWRCKECSTKHNEEYCNKDTKIADLEAKLVEYEKFMKGNKFNDIQDAQNAINGIFQDIFDEKHKVWISICDKWAKCEQENKQLKQQLAEKEKSFDWIYSKWQECVERQTKSKTEFAIQQLERVKEDVLDISNGYWRYFMKNGKEYMTGDDLESCLNETIDQIIKELEGGCEKKEV